MVTPRTKQRLLNIVTAIVVASPIAVALMQIILWLLEITPAGVKHTPVPDEVKRWLYVSAAVAVIMVVLYVRVSRRIPKRVALFLPRSKKRSETFWMEFEDCVRDNLAKKHCDVVTVNLETEYDEDEQVEKLKTFPWEEVNAAIVSPAGNKVIPIVISLMKEGRHILLHDAAPERAMDYFAKEDLSAKIVCVNNRNGGELAAEIMYERLILNNTSTQGYDILVLPGNKDHAHSNLRLSGFQRVLDEKTKHNVAWYHAEDGNWNYLEAKASLKEFLTKSLIIKGRRIHGIFVCNDEMALAAEDVISDLSSQLGFPEPIIVGFDYTESLEKAWARGKSRGIIGTVNAKVEAQARAVADFVFDLIKGENKSQSIVIVEPDKVTN